MGHYAAMQKVLGFLAFALTFLFAAPSLHAQDACSAPEPVCAARGAVYTIASFDPYSSAVRLSQTLLVASRHAIADEMEVTVTRKDGSTVTGNVLPSGYDGDLILIEVAGLADGKVLEPVASADSDSQLYTVGSQGKAGSIRVYPPGKVLIEPARDTPHGRLHHTAYSQFGNSGGALVDHVGRLVGIVASGGEGRFEAIPAPEIERLKRLSGPQFAERSAQIGRAVRRCIDLLDTPAPRAMPDAAAQEIYAACSASENRQLYDLAAQQLAPRQQLELALKISNLSVARDPNALNARLTLLTILHIARRYEDEVPHIRFLMEHLPAEPMVHRFAIQAGKWTGEIELANAALELLKKHNPAQARAAEQFLNADIPRPPPLQ